MNTVISRALATATAFAIATGGVLLGAGAATASPTASVSTACQSNCITDLTVGGTPEGVVFDFDTSALSRVKVVVTDVNGTNPYVVKEDNSWGSSYNLPVDDASRFAQGHAYRYWIYATDTGGSTWLRSGGFATLIRYASVTYNRLNIIKDGDTVGNGAGDFQGTSRCGEDDSWDDYAITGDHALSPLHWTYGDAPTELNDGDSIPLFQKTPCHGTVKRTIEAETAIGDDDDWGVYDPHPEHWVPESPYTYGSWSDYNYDEAYTHETVTDPLAPTATGSATTGVDMTSPFNDPVGEEAAVRYQVTGIASFTHWVPDVPVPADSSGPATLGVSVTAAEFPSVAAVKWNPNAFPAVGGPSATLVQWRAQGTSTWQSNTFLDTDADLFLANDRDLEPATTYDFVVSRQLSNGLTALASRTTFTTPALTTTIYDWPTDTVTKPLGTTVVAKVLIDGPAGRPVDIQSHRPGQQWTTQKTTHTDATGRLTVAIKVGAGYTAWRLALGASGPYAGQTTYPRNLVAQTAITGFNSTSKTAKTGAQLDDAIAVTPGAYRQVNLSFRKAGTAAWTVSKHLTAGPTGVVTLTETAMAGTYEWKADVASTTDQGTSAVTAIRTITGT